MAPDAQKPQPENPSDLPQKPKDDGGNRKRVKDKYPNKPSKFVLEMAEIARDADKLKKKMDEDQNSYEKEKKAEAMAKQKINDAVKQIADELKLEKSKGKKPNANPLVDRLEIQDRLKVAGRNYIEGLLKDPSFPGGKYLLVGGIHSDNLIDGTQLSLYFDDEKNFVLHAGQKVKIN